MYLHIYQKFLKIFGNTPKIAYQELLKKFGGTLKETSYDSKNDEYMTFNEKKVVKFDEYAKSVVLKENEIPKSCDVLFLHEAEQKWYLIEFKNGNLIYGCYKCKKIQECKKYVCNISVGCPRIEECPNSKVNERKYEIKEKIFESLLLLTKELNKTIDFFQKNMTFILVYNKKNNIPIDNIANYVSILSNFVPERLEVKYLKKIECLEKETFEKVFVEKYCV